MNKRIKKFKGVRKLYNTRKVNETLQKRKKKNEYVRNKRATF